ncbi:MAG: hypothetical protein V4480_02000 [Patescibacteria group bacterium]
MNTRPFDPTSKLDWFSADFGALFYTTIVVCIVLAVLVGGSYAIVSYFSVQTQILLLIGASVAIAFVIVFCLRRNWMVHGEPRQFRYICRWL